MKSTYRSYTETLNGKLYGSVNIPVGNGKYKKKRKRVANKTEARQWAQSQLAAASPHTGPGMLFEDMVAWYKNEHLVAPVYKDGKKLYGLRTWKSVRRVADQLAQVFVGIPLDELTVDVLTKYKRKELTGTSITTVNRRFALLRSMFKKAQQRKWVTESPFDSDTKLIETALENKRVSQLDDRLVKRLLARSRKSAQPLLHPALMLLAHTGGRPSEIYPYEDNDKSVPREPLTWDRVLKYDYQALDLVSYKSRIRKVRMVPASRGLEQALKKLHDRVKPADTDLVIPVTTFKRSWKTLCKSVGVSDIRMRDFRHYYNSYLVSRPDVNDMERLLILGHTEMKTNATYSKLDISVVEKFRTNGRI
jgi:integrase